MTEEEAKTKWCPFVRVAGPMQSEAEGTSYNRWPPSDGTTKAMLSEHVITLCIGSACMAWRWGVLHPLGGFLEYIPTPEIDRTISGKERPIGGYCGLAGKP